MGNCIITNDTNTLDSVQIKTNPEIILAAEKKLLSKRVTLLLLGSAESGKSTVLKQLRLQFGNGKFGDEEKVNHRSVIYGNLIQIAYELLLGMSVVGITPSHPDLTMFAVKDFISLVQANNSFHFRREDVKFPFMTIVIKAIAQEPNLKAIFAKSSHFTLLDSVYYWYPNEINRVFEPNYVPTEKDILNSRNVTKGIREYDLYIPDQDKMLRVIDVGGAKSQRKQWLSVFNDVNSVIFVAALNGYCQGLREAPEINRLQDSLALFDTVINNQYLKDTSMILFLNKIDLLKEHLNTVPFSKIFPDFTGDNSPQEASKYILKKFLALNQSPNRYICTHFTYATDRNQLDKILTSIKRIILKENFQSLGLL